MLARQNRFHGYNSLRHVYRGGQMARGPLFAVKVAANPRRGSYRAAVVVSRKVNKSAVARNRMRRRLYEAIRELSSQFAQPYDIVITIFSDAVLETAAPELAGQLRRQLKEVGVLK